METTEQKIEKLSLKIDQVYISVEKTRKYFLWTGIITVALIILPIIGLMFVLPSFMTNYVNNIQTLSL